MFREAAGYFGQRYLWGLPLRQKLNNSNVLFTSYRDGEGLERRHLAFSDTLPHVIDDTDAPRAFLSSFTENLVDKAVALRSGSIGFPLHRLAIHGNRQWPYVNHVAAD